MLLNAQSFQILFTGFQAAYGEAFAKFGVDATWDKAAMMTQSTTAQELYNWLGQSTGFREWLGDRVLQNLALHGFYIANKDFENTVVLKANQVLDDQYGVLTPLFQQLGQDAALHPDQLVYQLLAQGASVPCYDGQNFFDTDHPVGPQGAQVSVSNQTTGASPYAWYLLDTKKAIKPLIYQLRQDYRFLALFNPDDANVFFRKEFVYGVDARSNVGFGLWQLAHQSTLPLTMANYGVVKAMMGSIKKDNGQPMGIKGSLLLVPPSGETDARNTILVERLEGGANNPYYKDVEVLVCPWLE
jgi:phage major head subunit gpT-like protein